MMLVTFVLLAILTLGAVSASQDADVVAANDTETGDAILEESPEAVDNDVLESQEPIDSDSEIVGNGEPIALEDVNIEVRGDDFVTVSGEGDNVELCVFDIPQGVNGSIVVTSGNNEFFNKQLKDFDEDSYWDNGDGSNRYKITPLDVNFFNGLQSGDIVKFSLFEGDNLVGSKLSKYTYENDHFRLEDPFNVGVWNSEFDGIFYLDSTRTLVSIDSWTETYAVQGTFYVSANGKEYKYKPYYDEWGNAHHDWILSSFGIAQPGNYTVTVRYGTDDDSGDIIAQQTVNVDTFKNDTFRAIIDSHDYLIELYCPENSEGTVFLHISSQDFEDPYEQNIYYPIASQDSNQWLRWTFEQLGLEMEKGYDVTIVIDNGGNEIFRHDEGFWYGEFWPRDFVPNGIFVDINTGDFWNGDDDWVIQILIPETLDFSNGTFKVTSGSKNIVTRQLKYWEMDMDTDYRLYQYEIRYSDLNMANLKNGATINFNFNYDDGNGNQKTVKKIAILEKNTKEGYTRFNNFVNIRNDYDSRGPLYLDCNDSVVSVDVYMKSITGTFYVFANDKMYKYKVNYDEDENGGWHGWTLASFGITEPGQYPVNVTYSTDDGYGDLIAEGVLKVRTFNNDTFRGVTYSNDNLIALYCPDGADGNIHISIRKDDGYYPSNPVINHAISSEDCGKWLNWTFKELGCKLENGYGILITVISNSGEEVFDYEDNFWYYEFEPRDFVPNQTAMDIRCDEFWGDFDEDWNDIVTIYVPENSFIDGGSLTITSGAKTVFSKYINYWEMGFDDDYRIYEYTVLLRDLNLKGLKESILTYNFTYNDGSQKSIVKKVFFEKIEDEDRGTGYSFGLFKVTDANILDDDVVLLISDLPDGADDVFNMTLDIWGTEIVTTCNISSRARNEEGLYVWKVSEFNFAMFDFYPDLYFDLHFDFYKDGNEYQSYDYGGGVYYNPAIANGEIGLNDEENFVITFIDKPNVDNAFTIIVKKDGENFTSKSLTLSDLDQYLSEDEGWYLITPDVLGINETGNYEIITQFTRNGTPISYSSTFKVVDFVIDVRPMGNVADEILDWIFKIDLPRNTAGRAVVLVNGTEKVNKTLAEIGYSRWNRMGAYYIPLNDLQISESGKYNVELTVYVDEGNLSRTVETNVTVAVSPNTFRFYDIIYAVRSGDDFFEFSLGTPLPADTIVTLYLNDQIAVQSKVGVNLLDIGDPQFDKFRDEFGFLKPGNYSAKIVYTYSNGTNETIVEDSFGVLTKQGNVNITASSSIFSVDHAYVNIAAVEPDKFAGNYVLYIIVDPNYDDDEESFHIDVHDLPGRVWYDASTKKFDLGTLSVGTHTILVTYYADDLDDSRLAVTSDFFAKKFTLTVKKTATTLTAPTKTATFYKVGKKLVVTLKYSNKALAKKKVTIKVGSISKTLTTNSKGQVSVDISSLMPKTYYAYLKFAGDSSFKASSKKVTVQVKKATPKILAPIKGYKANVKVKPVTAILKDNKGKIIKNAKLTLRINGKNYIAKTNAKGVATFKVNNLAKKATFKGIVKFAGNKYFKPLNKAVTVVVK